MVSKTAGSSDKKAAPPKRRSFLLAKVVAYFFRRPNTPAARLPTPRSPSNGSGDAVCGSWPLLLLWFWLLALWSALCVVLCELWSVVDVVEDVLGATLLWPAFESGGFVVVLGVEVAEPLVVGVVC